jgi:AraC family ethanolamine operon transcriptional activator
MLAKRPEAEYNNQTAPNSVIDALLVSVHSLDGAARALSGGDSNLELPLWSEQRASPAKMKRFQHGLDGLFQASLEAPAVLESTEGRAIEMECLRRLIDLLTEPFVGVSTDRLGKDRTILLRQAVDFMHGRSQSPLTAMELCTELESSDRSLRRLFREAFGMGPLAYFRVIRLHAVRDALMRGSETNASVAQIAHQWGFHRLGAFANEYRRQFGELPSHTLGVRGKS